MKLSTYLTFILMFISLLSCFNDSSNTSTRSSSLDKVRIKTLYGDIVIRFHTKEAPLTVNRIKQLIKNGFYNGLTFHRVVPSSFVQTGDPTGKGDGGSGRLLKAEFSSLPLSKGSLAMARTDNDPNSADSQFFISLRDRNDLNGKYTVFAQVTSGYDVLSRLAVGDKMIMLTLE